ncbi:plasmid mobilization protein [Castellaniella hirudinis]|uniref:plasmid mobilization protein n=1 Tax=Castellaniella hirudinis TaxID=1144617 RepID=UPI0039C0AD74
MSTTTKRTSRTIKLNQEERDQIQKSADEAGYRFGVFVRMKALNQSLIFKDRQKTLSNINQVFGLLKAIYKAKNHTDIKAELRAIHISLEELKKEVRKWQ